MVDIKFSKIDSELNVKIDNENLKCTIVEKPFFDPKKQITLTPLR